VKQQFRSEESHNVREKILQTPSSVKKEGEDMLQLPEQRFFSPAARDEDHGEAGCPLAALGGPQWSRYLPAARGKDPMTEQVDA